MSKTIEIKITLTCNEEYYHKLMMVQAEGINELKKKVLKLGEVEKCDVEFKTLK